MNNCTWNLFSGEAMEENHSHLRSKEVFDYNFKDLNSDELKSAKILLEISKGSDCVYSVPFSWGSRRKRSAIPSPPSTPSKTDCNFKSADLKDEKKSNHTLENQIETLSLNLDSPIESQPSTSNQMVMEAEGSLKVESLESSQVPQLGQTCPVINGGVPDLNVPATEVLAQSFDLICAEARRLRCKIIRDKRAKKPC